MKKALFLFWLLSPIVILAQESVSLNLNGIDTGVSEKMKKNGDRISWYIPEGAKKMWGNVSFEISNTGTKNTDREKAALQADPDAEGKYTFSLKVDMVLKKVDKTKPVTIKVKVETILGNEVFAIVERDFSKISDPIVLDGYMWRAGNAKNMPERRLCLEFSGYMKDAELRKKIQEGEGAATYTLKDFQLYLKQNEKDDWKLFSEPLQGSISGGNTVKMSNPIPNWIDPSKKLYVRFSLKTPKGNFIWGEYAVEPHEYRKEHRATDYTGKAFDKGAALN